MAKQVIVKDIAELSQYKERILQNLMRSIQNIKQIICNDGPLGVFEQLKFDKVVTEPLTGEPENLIEAINQCHTYLVSIMAVEYLFRLYPQQVFVVNWGNISGYDIESIDGTIIAECFAATSYKSNGKLSADLKRLDKNDTANYKYEFFYDKEFTEKHRKYYQTKYPGIQVVKFNSLH